MIILITTRGRGNTFRSLVRRGFGVPTPKFETTHYEAIFGSWSVPKATYIFGDLERLAPWELRIAADLYRSMMKAGLRCLNDPARTMSRFELLVALHEEGINPFGVMRADERPRPKQFPVFLRTEDNHIRAPGELLHSQGELDHALGELRRNGMPLRGMLVVEQYPGSYGPGLWAKWGTWRIGDLIVVEHLAVDNTWLVKTGDHTKQTDEVIADERDGVATNRFAADLQPAFQIGGIEFGRADHARVGGCTVVYEINTNPYLSNLGPDPNPTRSGTRIMARKRIAEALEAIDTPEGGSVSVPPTDARRPIRWWKPGFVTPRRP
jgi:hypothetical protein